jgi:tRNA U34 5-carboxymethylaminomethyl modifying GTPase MnmE/TrmE
MNLVNDYFLLYHGITFEQNTDVEEIETKINDDAFSIFALILSTTRKESTKFLVLDSFKSLCSILNVSVPHNDNELYHLQHSILDSIIFHKSKSFLHTLHQSFEYLHNEEIINLENCNKLISLFDHQEIIAEDNIIEDSGIKKEKSSFTLLKATIENILKELEGTVSLKIQDDLTETRNYIDNQKFSIGITGVMNAGKSTMLNALMGKEILGSAVVPETANLTIVKHNIQENAKVYYWNESEWEKIVKSSEQLDSMKDFVNETNTIFGDELKSYIKPQSRFDEIKIEELSSYTSAEASQKKCNLVKYVELGSNLDFLSDGIEIVDTPGLDDPVIQREEITKEYIGACDMMLHLMNVSQSATLKDVEFIIDALLYQNISKLLIVITRADTVSKEQLDEVISYTKSSIKRQLESQNKDSKLDYILDTIKFIPISGKMALLHRTGREQEALDAGFTLEDTGILEIEEYLNETLFGSNSQKGELVVQSSKKQLLRVVEKETNSLNYELKLLSKSKDELEQELNNFNKKKEINKRILTAMSEDIAFYKTDSQDYIESLETFLEAELMDLQNVIKQRVVSDVRYTFEKMKKRPENSRIKVIVETAIKDGIIDVIRDYRYKFIKKSQTIGEQCEQKYSDMGFSIGNKNESFDAIGFFQDDFKSGFLTSSNEVLVSQIVNTVSKSKESKLEELSREIESFIKSEFKSIEDNIKKKAKEISIILIESFFATLNEPLLLLEQKLSTEEDILGSQISKFNENEENKAEVSISIHNKIKKMNLISNQIQGLY